MTSSSISSMHLWSNWRPSLPRTSPSVGQNENIYRFGLTLLLEDCGVKGGLAAPRKGRTWYEYRKRTINSILAVRLHLLFFKCEVLSFENLSRRVWMCVGRSSHMGVCVSVSEFLRRVSVCVLGARTLIVHWTVGGPAPRGCGGGECFLTVGKGSPFVHRRAVLRSYTYWSWGCVSSPKVRWCVATRQIRRRAVGRLRDLGITVNSLLLGVLVTHRPSHKKTEVEVWIAEGVFSWNLFI